MNNTMTEYHVHLENLNITQFSRLVEAARKTSFLVKALIWLWRTEKKETHQRQSENNRKENKTHPSVPCIDAELHAIINQ